MSITMTIEAPEKAAWFERRRAKFTPEKLGDLFVTFLMEQPPEVLEEEKRQTSFARFAGRWTAEEAVAFNDLTHRTVDEEAEFTPLHASLNFEVKKQKKGGVYWFSDSDDE